MAFSNYDSPLQPDDFSGRAAMIKIVCDRLKDTEFLSTVFVGGPKIGKTSVLRYLGSDRANSHLPSHSCDLRVYVDAGIMGANATAFDFWIQFFRRLRTQRPSLEAMIAFPLQKAEAGALTMYHLEDFFDECAKQKLQLVALVDNWESLLRNANFWPPASNFLHLVRYFGQRTPRALAFVVASQRPLLDLWDSTRNASPYYNILMSIELSVLSEVEIAGFVDAMFGDATPEIRKGITSVVFSASYGHPRLVSYFTWLSRKRFAETKSPLEAEDVEEAYIDPNGPLVGLIQEVRGALASTERQLVDLARNSPATLLPMQKERLRTLFRQGFVLPGLEI